MKGEERKKEEKVLVGFGTCNWRVWIGEEQPATLIFNMSAPFVSDR